MRLSDFDPGWFGHWRQARTFLEEWSRPGLTNFLGSVQVGGDVSSVRHPMFPPVSAAEDSSAYLTVDGTFLPATRAETSIAWTPWAIERECAWGGIRIRTTTSMPWGKCAIVQRLRFSHSGAGTRACRVALRLSGRCLNRGIDRWFWGTPKVGLTVTDLHDQSGMNPVVTMLPDGRGKCFNERLPAGKEARAWSAQALHPAPDNWLRNGDAEWTLQLPAGKEAALDLVMVYGEDNRVQELAVRLAGGVSALLQDTEADWRRLWLDVFRGGGLFSGRLPDLDVPEAIAPVAAAAVFSAVMLRRQHLPNGGKVRYSISMPRRVEACYYTNDWGMAGWLLARLDPGPTWQQLEIALTADIRKFNQINTLTDKGGDYCNAGWPYTADIYNAFFVAWQFVETEGAAVLQRPIQTVRGSETLLQAMEDLAFDYRRRLHPEYGLADYGPRQELLECVTTYEHMVAGLNAAAVWMLDRMAGIYRGLRREAEAAAARAEADALMANILRHLVVGDTGWFRTLSPDGGSRECRHVWDIAMVLMTVSDRIPAALRQAIVAAFRQELQTPTWVRALSPHDGDAAVSGVRADHQYNGAFGSWPAEMLLGLIRSGNSSTARDWLPGIALTARQGPFGQAYCDENVADPVMGAAAKVTDELPQCCHWCNIAGAMFFEVLAELARERMGGGPP